jgi:hypothetical protein
MNSWFSLIVTTTIYYPTPGIDVPGTSASVGTRVLVRVRLIHRPSKSVFDIAQPLDPCLPRIYRAAFTCDRLYLNNQDQHQSTITSKY